MAPPSSPPSSPLRRRPRPVIWLSVALAAVCLAVAAGTMDRLVLSRFESPGSESVTTRALLRQEFGTGPPSVLLLLTARHGTADSPQVAAAGRALERELAAQPGVAETASYWSHGSSPVLRSTDGRRAMILARMSGTVTEARSRLAALSPEFTRSDAVLTVRVGGSDEVFRQAAEQARTDFLRAELMVLPLVLLLLFLIYRRLPAAALTLAMGLFSVAATLALLRGVSHLTEVSTFAANLTLVMGIGLGVDYSLFVISRFREELRSGQDVPGAVAQSVAHAGRTVAFSGLTVLISLSCLLLFPFPFLRSFAYAGIGTVLTSVFAALVILPAALTRLGHRILPANSRPSRDWWSDTALRMMRHPLRYGIPALLLVLALASPAPGLRFGTPDDRVLPEDVSSRVVQQDVRDHFAAEETDAIQVLTPDARDSASTALALSRIPGVQQVDALSGAYAQGRRILGPNDASRRFDSPRDSWYSVVPSQHALESTESVDHLLSAVRTAAGPDSVRLGGYPAELHDFRSALTDRAPLVLALILAVTFLVLLLMTRSVLLPAKAMVLNFLSMAVMFGTLVWIFQEGHLSGLLGFTPTGSIEPSIPILMLCTAFGLSMDYEVLMLSRITEEYGRTGDLPGSVATGLARSGPLITSAAAVLAASFATYATSGIVYLKMLAVGMVVVILVDATLIRAVLVPVLMRLAGNANWWMPGRRRGDPGPVRGVDPVTRPEPTARSSTP
ncbi:MMPL family transporter [Streptomyces sp. NBC_01465]|uniref:MMPL family transporter n=1 Tax=Streptomyces sp. NBC_01465 TaxID=2903878 RepID=UPI002E34D50F|nr:MMPL family transporter [Streptomyces sp. NBC_01465]